MVEQAPMNSGTCIAAGGIEEEEEEEARRSRGLAAAKLGMTSAWMMVVARSLRIRPLSEERRDHHLKPRLRAADRHLLMLRDTAHSLLSSMNCPNQSCAMTYMRPSYEPVRHFPFPLYRYVDAGIPLNQLPCRLRLLFVPGHAGDHRQARSIGVETLRAAAIHKIGIEVYTLSNDEALGAFDGDVLLHQSKRVAQAIRFLTASNPPLFIAAHSMGGIAVLDALQMLAEEAEAPKADALLLLSVPIRQPVLACSASLSRRYRRLRRFWRSPMAQEALPAVASIWGGCRDWHVPAALSSLNGLFDNATALSLPTTALPNVWTPTDHLSILWCNQLVKVIAQSVVSLALLRESTEQPPSLEQRVGTLRASLLSIDTASSAMPVADDEWTSTDEEIALVWLYAIPIRALLDAACATLLLTPLRELYSADKRPHLLRLVVPIVLSTACGMLVSIAVSSGANAIRGEEEEDPSDSIPLPSNEWWRLLVSIRVLLASILLLLLHVISSLTKRRLAICAFAALTPNLAAWVRAWMRSSDLTYADVTHSSDAQDAVLCVLFLLVAPTQTKRTPGDVVVRLGAASGIVLCSGFALKDASSEAILRVAALGAATQLYGAV